MLQERNSAEYSRIERHVTVINVVVLQAEDSLSVREGSTRILVGSLNLIIPGFNLLRYIYNEIARFVLI